MNEIIIILQKCVRGLQEFQDLIVAMSAIVVLLIKDIRTLIIYIVRTVFDFVCWPFRMFVKIVKSEIAYRRFVAEFDEIPIGYAAFIILDCVSKKTRYFKFRSYDAGVSGAYDFLLYKNWIRFYAAGLMEIDERIYKWASRMNASDKKNKHKS